ncbi:alpha/beta fold hydrolase [Pseudomonas sp. EpS/L25]|uniref:alpha/beta fold hydrolase n=1 Tax=Pseudomonas sp. EpS/L25 TaxID=1749078 RepID=UPI00074344E4|nr:alpha/beta hydrolase [Pseudomonas sp. EpS/L25]KUM43264.1 alpha/beta hydrolase [Pseudomonas sp. EpS/L25]
MKPSFAPSRHVRTPRAAWAWLIRIGALLGASTGLAGLPAMAAAPAHRIANIVLVHGAFVDGSSWSPVLEQLTAMGYHVTAVQNPLSSLKDDVSATERVLRRQNGDVLLVGHSWAGTVISQAGNAPNVKGLVYVSALAPDSGESTADLLSKLGASAMHLVPDQDGLLWLDSSTLFHSVMAADLPATAARSLAARQQPIAASSFGTPIEHAAWRDKPSWYLQTLDDQALAPSVQRAIAQRLGATLYSVHSSHLSLLSQPTAVVRLIDEAAREATDMKNRRPARTMPTPHS